MPFEKSYKSAKVTWLTSASLLMGLGALILSVLAFTSRQTAQQKAIVESALQRIKRTGVMRVGYGGFPPYTIVDPRESDPNKRVSGFAVDMVNEIAARYSPPLKVDGTTSTGTHSLLTCSLENTTLWATQSTKPYPKQLNFL
jgi:hypothetical protein